MEEVALSENVRAMGGARELVASDVAAYGDGSMESPDFQSAYDASADGRDNFAFGPLCRAAVPSPLRDDQLVNCRTLLY